MIRRTITLAVTLAACAKAAPVASPSPADPIASLVGIEHPPRRTDIVERSSYLLDESDRGRWVVAELTVAAPRARAVSLEEMVSGGTKATARWRTVAVQRIAAIDSLLPVHLGTCEVAGRHDRFVIGVGKASATVAVRQAWRVDTVARRIVDVDPATVHCVDLTNT